MVTRIDGVSSRGKLKPRRESCWQRVRKGCYVGYRKMTTAGHGAWMARARDEGSGTKQLFKPPGDFGELPDHLRFDAAAKAATAWFDHLGQGGARAPAAVSEPCARYVRHLKATTSERAARPDPTARSTAT